MPTSSMPAPMTCTPKFTGGGVTAPRISAMLELSMAMLATRSLLESFSQSLSFSSRSADSLTAMEMARTGLRLFMSTCLPTSAPSLA